MAGVPLQRPELQSAPLPQDTPASHPSQLPPQSTSFSVPSFLPLAHVAGRQAPAAPHSPELHSRARLHGAPGDPSAAQSPWRQVAPAWQSASTAQPFPGGHGAQPPPQSTPVSSPLRSVSAQPGTRSHSNVSAKAKTPTDSPRGVQRVAPHAAE